MSHLITAVQAANIPSTINAGPFGLGGSEMIIILVIVLLLFGGKKIPELMKGLGKGVKEFKDASKGEGETTTTTEKKD
jgi:sec-independent protein translocase protein TatA